MKRYPKTNHGVILTAEVIPSLHGDKHVHSRREAVWRLTLKRE